MTTHERCDLSETALGKRRRLNRASVQMVEAGGEMIRMSRELPERLGEPHAGFKGPRS